MRRFSQRSHLVTLSEINITPLLDLAFVLLIIFVITTPLLENSRVQLPKGGRADRPPAREDVRNIEISARPNEYKYQGRLATPEQVERELLRERAGNPNLILNIRADQAAPWDKVFRIQDFCAENGIAVSLRSNPRENR